MKLSICRYSFHRTWKEKGLDCYDLALAVKKLDVEGVDFHVRFLGSPAEANGQIKSAIEKTGVLLALENHNLPDAAQEQVEMIKKINSKNLRATVDIGNYMSCGQEAHIGTAIAASYAAYVHFKDFKKKTADLIDFTREDIDPCIVGQGDVDHLACLREFKKVGYNGFIALEYAAAGDELYGISQSVKFIKKLLENKGI